MRSTARRQTLARSGGREVGVDRSGISANPSAIAGFGFDEPDVWPRMSQKFTLEVVDGEGWRKLASGKTNGHGMKQSIKPVTAQKFRLTMECDKGSPGVAELQLYREE